MIQENKALKRVAENVLSELSAVEYVKENIFRIQSSGCGTGITS
jgi:hypothetical protein